MCTKVTLYTDLTGAYLLSKGLEKPHTLILLEHACFPRGWKHDEKKRKYTQTARTQCLCAKGCKGVRMANVSNRANTVLE